MPTMNERQVHIVSDSIKGLDTSLHTLQLVGMWVYAVNLLSPIFFYFQKTLRGRATGYLFISFCFQILKSICFFERLILVLNFFIKRDIGFLYELIFLIMRNDIS